MASPHRPGFYLGILVAGFIAGGALTALLRQTLPDSAARTFFTNTWTAGSLPAGQTKTLVWKVSAVRSGTYTLRFRVNAGLNGKAKASEDGKVPAGSFIARVSDKVHPVNVD